MQTLAELRNTLPQPGRIEWIGTRPDSKHDVVSRDAVEARAGVGLEGDHHRSTANSARQVTLVQFEHLAVVSALCGRGPTDPAKLRRNLAISGINLLALKGRRFRIGDAILEGTGPCEPCSLMERILGPGGYNAMRGHGGITARIVQGGWIRLGDAVAPEAATPEEASEES